MFKEIILVFTNHFYSTQWKKHLFQCQSKWTKSRLLQFNVVVLSEFLMICWVHLGFRLFYEGWRQRPRSLGNPKTRPGDFLDANDHLDDSSLPTFMPRWNHNIHNCPYQKKCVKIRWSLTNDCTSFLPKQIPHFHHICFFVGSSSLRCLMGSSSVPDHQCWIAPTGGWSWEFFKLKTWIFKPPRSEKNTSVSSGQLSSTNHPAGLEFLPPNWWWNWKVKESLTKCPKNSGLGIMMDCSLCTLGRPKGRT